MISSDHLSKRREQYPYFNLVTHSNGCAIVIYVLSPLQIMASGDIDIEDYYDVMIIATFLVGTSSTKKIDDIIRLHKMAFLMDKIMADEDLDDDLDFGPDKLGPFSENLEDSVNMLSNWGIFESSKHGKSKTTALTEDGAKLFSKIEERYPGTVLLGKEINGNLDGLSTGEIVKMIYRLYPSQTVNSLIKDDLVTSSRVDSFEIDNFNDGNQTIETENGKRLNITVDGNEITISGGDLFA